MGYEFYHYTPSTSASVAFAAVFGLTTVIHIYQMFKNRTWYFIPFIIGGMFEAFGYLSRYVSANQTPNWTTGPYVGQSLLLLLAPSLFAASIYMILGRIIRMLNGGVNSLVRPTWLTKIFVTGDVLSFLIQSGGGGMLATAKSQSTVNLGQHMIVIGLVVQLIFFGFFMVVSVVFHRRMLATPMHAVASTAVPWTLYMKVIYVASILIMVRSIYRAAEYAQGDSGYLQSKEAFMYIFDTTLMFVCCLVFNVFHPSKIVSKEYLKQVATEDVEMLHDGRYPRA